MEATTDKLKKIIRSKPVSNEKKLKKQQEYYKRLSKKGVAKKETYSLKPISCI